MNAASTILDPGCYQASAYQVLTQQRQQIPHIYSRLAADREHLGAGYAAFNEQAQAQAAVDGLDAAQATGAVIGLGYSAVELGTAEVALTGLEVLGGLGTGIATETADLVGAMRNPPEGKSLNSTQD